MYIVFGLSKGRDMRIIKLIASSALAGIAISIGGIAFLVSGQAWTFPIGLFMGGFMVDSIFEPFMAGHAGTEVLTVLFGSGKGSGAAVTMFVLGLAGTLHCLVWGHRMKQYTYTDGST